MYNMLAPELPGDELILSPAKTVTHTITINAPSEMVWPWIVQLGAGRAGWYSYDRIDNGGVPSAKKIIPELQRIAVGDIMPAVPGAKDAFIIQQILPGRALVLVVPIQTAVEEPDTLQRMAGSLRVSWVLALETLGHEKTKLISRGRISRNWFTPSSTHIASSKRPIFIERIYDLLAKMPWFLMVPVAMTGHLLMESQMLRGIKRRAEGRYFTKKT
jgi:hypothetical protein